MNLVDAQQARRMLDRMVGYEISPLLWAKVKRGLSAGRVQSVALRIICDREEEISNFIPKEYYTLDVVLGVKGGAETSDSEVLRHEGWKDGHLRQGDAGFHYERTGECQLSGYLRKERTAREEGAAALLPRAPCSRRLPRL